MKMRYGKDRQAVAPVLATLLMIAVAVAMSVIIFMWSQGFLSQTSSATGGQQGQQNVAAQSSVSIESATFTIGTTGSASIIVRNVGAVSITIGSILVQGSSSNSGFQGSALAASFSTSTTTVTTFTASSATCTTSSLLTACGSSKGQSITISVTGLTNLASGDVINVKVTTNVGTFAQSQFTVP